jgi:hypothetical protein
MLTWIPCFLCSVSFSGNTCILSLVGTFTYQNITQNKIVIINYYLKAQVVTNFGRRTIKGIYSTCLIPIETKIAVHQEVAYPELLQRIWVPLCQLIST